MLSKITKILLLIILTSSLSTPISAFADISPEKQQEFINSMLPNINQANSEVKNSREKLLSLFAIWKKDKSISQSDKEWVQNLALQYQLDNLDFSQLENWQTLIERVDVLPNSLVLAQTILESAWGKSYIAHNANNYFGHFCSISGCGIKQRNSKPGSDEAKSFQNPLEAVRAYLLNINSRHEYEHLRLLRLNEHKNNQKLNGIILADGLDKYSILGKIYVYRIKRVINQNKLEQYDNANTVQISLNSAQEKPEKLSNEISEIYTIAGSLLPQLHI